MTAIGEVAIAIGTLGVGTVATKAPQGSKLGQAALNLFEKLGDATIGPKAFRERLDKLNPNATRALDNVDVGTGAGVAGGRRVAASSDLFESLDGDRQKDMPSFVEDVLTQAASGTGRYKSLDAGLRREARSMLREFRAAPHNVSGNIIGVDLCSRPTWIGSKSARRLAF